MFLGGFRAGRQGHHRRRVRAGRPGRHLDRTGAGQSLSRERGDPARRSVAAAAIRGAYAAELLRVIDGDTFEARVHLWPGLDVTTKVRLRGIDAPELHARCAEERIKAEDARSTLSAILAEGEITVHHVALDKYGGRVLADAATPAIADVSQALLQKGTARAYAGGRRGGWCGLP